jgi:esterase/lipase superfamily enzyme
MQLDRTAVSRRTALRGLLSAATGLAVGGCAGIAANGPRFGASELATRPTLLVATTRKSLAGARAKPWFGTERSRTITLARAAMTPPDDGRFSLSAVGLSDWSIAAIEPVAQIDDLLGQATSGRNLLVYVHGFNQTFEAAALDAARLSDSIKFGGDTLVFSWPSRARLLDYNYDRESAMQARPSAASISWRTVSAPC